MYASAFTHSLPNHLTGVRATKRTDAHEVEAAVRRHCRDLRATTSTTVAAVNLALRQAGDTLSAIRAGNRRAEQLHARDRFLTPPIKA
jgi:hypothetical protein